MPDTAALTVLKHRQRKRLDECDVPQPRWEVATAPADGLPLPAVVKPVDRQGQKGLAVVEDADEYAAAIDGAVEASRSGLASIEELVPGPEVTVNAFSLGGVFHPLTVTDRLTAGGEAFGVALAHVWPSCHPVDEAVEAARLAADALGVTDGPTYTQLVLGPDGPRVMELAARLGGGHDAELCRAALGVDLNGLALAAALGEPLEVPEQKPSGGAAVRFLVPPAGVLEDVSGLDEAREAEGVLDARVYRSPGWTFGAFRRGSDRAGFVLARKLRHAGIRILTAPAERSVPARWTARRPASRMPARGRTCAGTCGARCLPRSGGRGCGGSSRSCRRGLPRAGPSPHR